MTMASISSSSVKPPVPVHRALQGVGLTAIADVVNDLARVRIVVVPHHFHVHPANRRQRGLLDLAFPAEPGRVREVAPRQADVGKLLDKLNLVEDLRRNRGGAGEVLIAGNERDVRLCRPSKPMNANATMVSATITSMSVNPPAADLPRGK